MKNPCGQCEYQAITKGSLFQHKRSIHEGIKYPCAQCEYQATTKSNLKQHRKSVHEEEKHPWVNPFTQSPTIHLHHSLQTTKRQL